MKDNDKEDNAEVPDWATDPEFIHRFWRRVERDVDLDESHCDSPCHIYVGTRSLDEVDVHNYQRIYIPPKYNDHPAAQIAAHRVSFCVKYLSPLNRELDIHHNCNIPACIRHLEKVSRSENIKQAYRDGLATPPDNEGEENGFADLTEDEVLEIHYEFHTTEKSTREIAAAFNIDPGHTRRILQGWRWPHIYEKICEEIPEEERRQITNRGEYNGLADFDRSTIRQLFRDRFQRGLTTHQLADRYSTEERYIRKILNRKRWGHVEVADITCVPDDINDRPDEATSPGPKLTPDSVRAIFRDRYDEGLTYKKLANRYGVSVATIGRVLRRVTWTSVDVSDIEEDSAGEFDASA